MEEMVHGTGMWILFNIRTRSLAVNDNSLGRRYNYCVCEYMNLKYTNIPSFARSVCLYFGDFLECVQ